MEMFKEIIDSINKYGCGMVYTVVPNKKLNRNLLMVYSTGAGHHLRLYDEKVSYNLNPVAEITFMLNGKRCFVSAIKTESGFQRCGLATEIMQMALSYADLCGSTSFYGEVKPTDPMDGVDENDPDFYEKQVELLKVFYKKQGAEINGESFSGSWNPGEKLAGLNSNQVAFLKNMQELQNQAKFTKK